MSVCFRISGDTALCKNIHESVSRQMRKNFAKSKWRVTAHLLLTSLCFLWFWLHCSRLFYSITSSTDCVFRRWITEQHKDFPQRLAGNGSGLHNIFCFPQLKHRKKNIFCCHIRKKIPSMILLSDTKPIGWSKSHHQLFNSLRLHASLLHPALT